jgi:hypothetical protein
MNQDANIIQTNVQTSESNVIEKENLSVHSTVGVMPNLFSECVQRADEVPHHSEHSEDDCESGAYDFHYESGSTYSKKLAYLTEQIKARTGGGLFPGEKIVSQKIVVQQALERYFLLISEALNGIQLDHEEMRIILNSIPSPVWQWGLNVSLATRIADACGADEFSKLDANSTFVKLITKLQKLTLLQEAALIDFCERFWREGRKGDYSFDELCSKLGFELVD